MRNVQYTHLKDLFKWEKYDHSDKEDIMVLEQHLWVLQLAMKMGVKVEQAARQVDDFVAAHKGPGASCYSEVLQTARGKSEGQM